MTFRWVVLAAAGGLLAASCASPAEERAGAVSETPSPALPTPTPTAAGPILPPVLYFNLSEEDALAYLEALDVRIEEALHQGDLGELHDLYTSDGPARRKAAARILLNFRRQVVDRLRYEVLSTKILKIRPQAAVFRQVRHVHPCAYTYGDQYDVTPDHRVIRQVVIRYMADEQLNWRIDREVVLREEPTGERVTACPQ